MNASHKAHLAFTGKEKPDIPFHACICNWNKLWNDGMGMYAILICSPVQETGNTQLKAIVKEKQKLRKCIALPTLGPFILSSISLFCLSLGYVSAVHTYCTTDRWMGRRKWQSSWQHFWYRHSKMFWKEERNSQSGNALLLQGESSLIFAKLFCCGGVFLSILKSY